jgi:hypothetical protein
MQTNPAAAVRGPKHVVRKGKTPGGGLWACPDRGRPGLMRLNTPINRLVSRHTRELLRAYFKAGKLKTRIADRRVEDRFIHLSPQEREIYDAVEDYIASTYNQAVRM